MEQLTPDYVLLGLLAVRPAHGYHLLEVFRQPEALGEVWDLSTSQLYAVLKRLESKGWIRGQTLTSGEAPPRTEYQLTPEGQAQLELWLHQPKPSASIRRVRVEFLSRLYVARILNLPTTGIVQAQKRACQQAQQALSEEKKQRLPSIGLLTLDFVLFQLEAVLAWLDRCELVPQDVLPEEPRL